ncbi:MAG: DNA gyrase inhibitor YacG [Myxococcota bacterium]
MQPHHQAKKCPVCQTMAGAPTVNRAYPFCSARCRQIDLGRWLSEDYRIPEAEPSSGGASQSNNVLPQKG